MLTVHVLIVAIDSESSILRTHLATRGLSVGRLLRGRENPRGRPSAEVASLGTACDSERDGHHWRYRNHCGGQQFVGAGGNAPGNVELRVGGDGVCRLYITPLSVPIQDTAGARIAP